MNKPFITKRMLTTVSKLNRLVYLLYYVKRVTTDEFRRLYRIHYMKTSPMHVDEKRLINNQNMQYRQLVKPDAMTYDMTYNKFIEYVYGIMNYEIEVITIKVRNPETGEIETYSSDDNVDELMKKYGREREEEPIITIEKIDGDKNRNNKK